MKLHLIPFIAILATAPAYGQQPLKTLYEPQVFDGLPVRIMKPMDFDATKRYPVIVSLHGAGGRGTSNDKQLKDWNRQLAEPQRRKDFPCYVVAPQANELWNAAHFNKTKALIKTLPSVDTDRIYIMGHSMGGHGSYIFIQIDTEYFAAATPSAGAGRKVTEDFIDAEKIKDIPIWAFHGDKDSVCPYERDRKVFDKVKALGGNMKLTTWAGDNHGVSGKMIPGADNGTTEFSSNRCDSEPDFMTWMFSQSRKFGEARRRNSGLKTSGNGRGDEPERQGLVTSSTTKELQTGEYFVTQTWSQERNFLRPYFVNVPEASTDSTAKMPVFIFLHGNGGNAKDAMRGWLRNRRRIAERYIMVFAQGYRESWNIVSERSKADDVGFIEAIVKELAQRKNVAANDFTIMGNSNGAALVNQLAIESRLPNIRNYISGVSPLNGWQYDGKQFKSKGDDNNYRVAAVPMAGKRLLNISGTEDKLVPYIGGPSKVIPAKDGKLAFVHAEESTFLWAKAMGYEGEQLTKPTSTSGDIEFFSYLDGDVIHCKVNNAGHGATHEISEESLLEFLQNTKAAADVSKTDPASDSEDKTERRGFPKTAFEYAKMVEPDLGVPPRVDLDKAVEIPLYVDGVQTWGNLGRNCDNPTFLGKDTVSGSRLQRYEGNTANGRPLKDVVWVAFGRNSSQNHKRVIGSVQMIGYNRRNGATAFFESSDRIGPWVTLDEDTLRMRGTMPWIDEPHEFNRAFRTPGKVQCVECHQNDPFITNSFINAAKIPGTEDSVVPALDRNSPYYVIGGDNWDMRTIHIKGNACFECHRVGMSTMTLFMKNGWQPNDHMPPHNPGSLADDLKELLEAWTKGPDHVAGAEWIIPPARGKDSRIVGKDYPHKSAFNGGSKLSQASSAKKDLDAFGTSLKAKVKSGDLTEKEAIEIYFEAAGGKK